MTSRRPVYPFTLFLPEEGGGMAKSISFMFSMAKTDIPL